jgi:DNA-binding NarL/FixJ family response regulator
MRRETTTVPHGAAAQPMHPLKTYIVEDNPLIRESLIATLDELVSIELVGVAQDEATAVQWLTRSGKDAELVIVDIFLKAGSGLGVLRAANAARASQGSHGTQSRRKLVVLSNYATPDIRRQCLGLGADRVFDKSNDIDELIQYCGRLAAGGSGDSLPGALP